MLIEFLKKNKVYVVIIFILLIYVSVVFLLFKNDDSKKNEISGFLVTNNSLFNYNRKDNWTLSDQTNIFNWNDYNIYIDNDYFGKYMLQYNKRWYIFDQQRNSIKYDGDLLAFSGVNVDVYKYNFFDITDSEKESIDDFINSYGLENINYSLIKSKVEIDIDNDGILEKFYQVSSPISNYSYDIFSMILLEKNNKISSIVSNIVGVNSNHIYSYDIYGFIDINGDKRKEIVISRILFSQPDSTCETIFQFKNQNYEKLVGC